MRNPSGSLKGPWLLIMETEILGDDLFHKKVLWTGIKSPEGHLFLDDWSGKSVQAS